MPWGREKGAGVSPPHRSCPKIAPPSITSHPASVAGADRARRGTETRARTPCGCRAPHLAPRCPLFLGVPKPALAGYWGHCPP